MAFLLSQVKKANYHHHNHTQRRLGQMGVVIAIPQLDVVVPAVISHSTRTDLMSRWKKRSRKRRIQRTIRINRRYLPKACQCQCNQPLSLPLRFTKRKTYGAICTNLPSPRVHGTNAHFWIRTLLYKNGELLNESWLELVIFHVAWYQEYIILSAIIKKGSATVCGSKWKMTEMNKSGRGATDDR